LVDAAMTEHPHVLVITANRFFRESLTRLFRSDK